MAAASTVLTALTVTPGSTVNPLLVNVAPNGAKRFSRVRAVNLINGVGASSNPPACSLGSLLADNIGATAFPNGLIQATSINSITAANTIAFADIRTRDWKNTTPDTGNYDIGTITATNGSIHDCTISAGYHGFVDPVPTSANLVSVVATATGGFTVGHITDTSIYGYSSIGSVLARSAISNVPFTTDGNITLISCSAGGISGTVRCVNIGTTQTDPNAGVRALAGTINFTSFFIDNLKSPMLCQGSSFLTSPSLVVYNDVTADIKATAGAIGKVLAGRIIAPSGGTAPVIEGTSSGGGSLPPIDYVSASGYGATPGDITATIRSNTGPGAGIGKGVINRVAAVGTFTGSITANSIPSLFIRNLSSAGTINVEKIDSGIVGTTTPWQIGRDLSGAINVTGAPAALSGFVLVNSELVGSGWLPAGSVTISPVATLSPEPAYTAVAVSLGGGAVGEVPFQLHAEDSMPVNVGSTIGRFGFSTLTSYPGTITAEVEEWPIWQYAGQQDIIDAFYAPGRRVVHSRFYGPLARTTSGGQTMEQGVRIQRWNTSTTCWDERTDQFVVSDVPYAGTVSRELKIDAMLCRTDEMTPTIEPGLYRVVRNTDPNTSSCGNTSRSTRLYSSIPASSTTEVAQFAHYFRLGIQCNPADLGGPGGLPGPDGILDNNDFIAHIDYFFNNDAHADLGQVGGVYGADGIWDNNDFIAFISLFFSGCANPEVCVGPGGRSDGGDGEDLLQRQIDALQMFYDATGDARILQRLLDATFAVGQ